MSRQRSPHTGPAVSQDERGLSSGKEPVAARVPERDYHRENVDCMIWVSRLAIAAAFIFFIAALMISLVRGSSNPGITWVTALSDIKWLGGLLGLATQLAPSLVCGSIGFLLFRWGTGVYEDCVAKRDEYGRSPPPREATDAKAETQQNSSQK